MATRYTARLHVSSNPDVTTFGVPEIKPSEQNVGVSVILPAPRRERSPHEESFPWSDSHQTHPVTLGPDHPITIALRVLLSTGTATNGPYDVLTRENSAGVPQALIDVAALELIRGDGQVSSAQFQFTEIEPQDAKAWVEGQIFRPLNILPYVNQAGQYSGRLLKTPLPARAAIATGLVTASA